MVREVDISKVKEARFTQVLETIKIFRWIFKWWGWFLFPIFSKFIKSVEDVGFRYCSNCMYRHSCGACVLFAGGVTPVNVLQMMHDNNIKGLHLNWEGVFKELDNIYKMCLDMHMGNTCWSDKVYRV